MRPMYLGESRMDLGRILIHGINQMIITNIGLNNIENIEELCKLTFYLKKNFHYKELLDNFDFIQNVHNFAISLLGNFPNTINGVIYLMLFFGNFSSLINLNQLIEKNLIIPMLYNFSKIFLEKILNSEKNIFYEIFESCDEYLFYDLINAFGSLTTGM